MTSLHIILLFTIISCFGSASLLTPSTTCFLLLFQLTLGVFVLFFSSCKNVQEQVLLLFSGWNFGKILHSYRTLFWVYISTLCWSCNTPHSPKLVLGFICHLPASQVASLYLSSVLVQLWTRALIAAVNSQPAMQAMLPSPYSEQRT